MIKKTKQKAQTERLRCDFKGEDGRCVLRPKTNPVTGIINSYDNCKLQECPRFLRSRSFFETMELGKRKEEKDKEYNSKFQNLLEKNSEPKPLQIDEVAYAYFNQVRVNSWNILSNDYAGHKVGALYAFVLNLIEEHITESVNPVLRQRIEDVKNNFIELPYDYIFNGLKPPKEDK